VVHTHRDAPGLPNDVRMRASFEADESGRLTLNVKTGPARGENSDVTITASPATSSRLESEP